MRKRFYTFEEIKSLILMIRSSESEFVRKSEMQIMQWIVNNSDTNTLMAFSDYFNRGEVTKLGSSKIHAKTDLDLFVF